MHSMEVPWKKICKALTIIVMAGVLVTAVVIMAKGSGLQDSLDFGAGAYFYADIPEFDKYLEDAPKVSPSVPFWVYLSLFLGWGALMYWLWTKIDK